MRPAKILILVPLVILGFLPTFAREWVLDLDPEKTEVFFDLKATGHDVHGAFGFQKGHIVFDPDVGVASGEIVVNARLGQSGNKKRDKTMHRKVLESEEFPLFVFTPRTVEGQFREQGTSMLQVHGTMAIHGQSHPMTLATEVQADGAHVAVRSSFGIPYVDWGLHNPSILILRVAKEVQVNVSTEGTLSYTKTADASSGH